MAESVRYVKPKKAKKQPKAPIVEEKAEDVVEVAAPAVAMPAVLKFDAQSLQDQLLGLKEQLKTLNSADQEAIEAAFFLMMQ